MKVYLLVTLVLFGVRFAHAEEEGKAKDRIGPGKAVVAADEKQ